MSEEKRKFVCLNRSATSNPNTFNCSLHGQLVDIQCCKECERKALETPREKKEREIRVNERLIEYHQSEIGRLRKEILELSEGG